MRHNKNKPEDKRIYMCPQCLKPRMSRSLTHIVSSDTTEFKVRDGTTIKLLTDICEYCIRKNYRTYFEPTRSDVRKILKAMNDDDNTSGVSLEELL